MYYLTKEESLSYFHHFPPPLYRDDLQRTRFLDIGISPRENSSPRENERFLSTREKIITAI